MTKRNVKSFMVIAMLLVVALYFISGTYARYIDEFDGTGTATVAKWAVQVNGAEEKEFTVDFKQESNQYVVDGLLAPDVTLKSTAIPIDLTGTEVAVDVEAEIDEAKLQTALTELGDSKEDISTEVKVYKGESEGEEQTGTIELPEGKAFTAENGKYCVIVKVTWTEKSEHNASDTEAGEKSARTGPLTLNIPVKLTLKQHLAKDAG